MIVKLRELRESSGKTQEEMAELIGLSSANAYSLKERGERKFSLDEAKIIADSFNLRIEDIFFASEITNSVITNEFN